MKWWKTCVHGMHACMYKTDSPIPFAHHERIRPAVSAGR